MSAANETPKSSALYIGIDVDSVPSTLVNFLDAIKDTNHDFASLPLLKPAAVSTILKSSNRSIPPFAADQLCVDTAGALPRQALLLGLSFEIRVICFCLQSIRITSQESYPLHAYDWIQVMPG